MLLYNGPIEKSFDEKVIDECLNTRRRENVVLILCTFGGDPDVGYRIARCLQQKYKTFTIWIAGPCKSAGTLITVGAHEIVMSDHGEMGPLDIQVGKKDEIWETDSGLTVLSAIKALEEKSYELFEECFLSLKARSGGRITLRTATKMASKLAIGTVAPIVAQIDPMHVGEVSRAMNIGLEYGGRLNKVSENAKPGTLKKLSESYPSHSFVIDRDETKNMFANVREPTDKETEFISSLGLLARYPQSETFFCFVTNPRVEELNESHNERDHSGGATGGEQTVATYEGANPGEGSESAPGEKTANVGTQGIAT